MLGAFLINLTESISVSAGSYARITDCVFDHNKVIDGPGGSVAVHQYAQVQIQGCKFVKSVGSFGAILDVLDALVNMSSCTMQFGLAEITGGAISCREASDVRLNDVLIEHCRAPFGGAMSMIGTSSVIMNNVTIRGNSARSFPETSTLTDAHFGGGAISLSSPYAKLLAQDSVLEHNVAAFSYGGALAVSSGSVSLLNTRLIGNTAKISGGGLFALGATIVLEQCMFDSNSAEQGGGLYRTSLIEQLSADFNVTACTFHNNSAGETGGGIDFSAGVAPTLPVLISHTVFIGNRAVHGGAINIADPLFARWTNLTFRQNQAVSQLTSPSGDGLDIPVGGALRLASFGQLNVSACEFSNNSVINGLGGAVYTADDARGTVTFLSTAFTSNRANGGGAVYMAGRSHVLRNVFQNSGPHTNQFSFNQALYGADVAADGVTLDWFPAPQSQLRSEVRTGSELGLMLTSNASALATVRANVYDHFNQVVRWIATPTTFSLVLTDPVRADLIGSTRTTLNAQGDVVYTGVRVAGQLGLHAVKVTAQKRQASDASLQTPAFNFNVSTCGPGEFMSEGVQSRHGVCRRCAVNQYGLDGITCKLCPSGAICRDGNIEVRRHG